MELQHYNANDLLVRTAVAACAIACKASSIAKKTRYGSATHCDQVGLQLVVEQLNCIRHKFELYALPASSKVTILADGGTNTASTILINGVIISSPVLFTTDTATTARLVADAINSITSTPDYTATVNNSTITITAVTKGDSSNGFAVTIVGGDFTAIRPHLTGGQDGVDEDDAIITEEELEAVFSNISTYTGCCYAPLGYGYESPVEVIERLELILNSGNNIELNSGDILVLNQII